MRVSANVRIQWLHGELSRNTYPNAARLAELGASYITSNILE